MEKKDLSTPFLPSQSHSKHVNNVTEEPQFIITVHDPQAQKSPNGLNFKNLDDPFEFLGSKGYEMLDSTTVDPFRNGTYEIEGVYEWLKIGICLPIALVRMVLFGVCLSVGYVATKIALLGWKDKENPFPKWRCRIMWITRFATRGILFAFGYHWIKRRGKPAPRDTAPIIVSNHVSYVDPIFFFYEIFPTIVASDSHDSMPVVGTIIRAMQVIYVNRFSPSSRKHAISEIKRKASCNRFPRVLLFPEGTTTNGRSLISFQLGAFIPGYAIQPVVVRYPHVHFDQSWGNISLARLMFRMFTQFHNFMEVEYLPVILPQINQKENAVQYSKRTSQAMCMALNVVQTSHSFGDVMLLAKANESKQVNPSLYMVEMAQVELAYHISCSEAVQFLDRFLSMKPDSSGHVGIGNFLRILRLKHCTFSEEVFGYIDMKKTGRITFKQFLLGSVHVLKQPLFAKACEFAFRECDISGKQYISEQELGRSVIMTMPNLNEYEIHELFLLFDCNRDGRICRDDFMACLRQNPLLISLFAPQLLQLGLFSKVCKRTTDNMVS
ncbi:Lysophospholipid acyltransferase LPEAT2 [Heracleum sosnowskyi]|uniref:Lysophospholipid acyltransferase LPEAT2 n=1 Tax=Heracleum sosnowskyi TaxID=360622 RepID=A0AAD8IY05_9APIA|nr:Lysophospholipid acyltransferase LPEAT2 [Heracleum sosnowskyi]